MLSLRVLMFAFGFAAVLVLLYLAALLLLRWLTASRKRAVEDAVRVLEPALFHWLMDDTRLPEVVATLRGHPRQAAFRSLARLATKLVPFERQQQLASALRHEPWVVETLRQGHSRLWWRRFDAARLLSIVGSDDDAALIAALLHDRSAAIRLVAFDAAARLTQRDLINRTLDDLPTRQDAVQAYQFAALGRHPREVGAALLQRLQPDETLASLNAWIDASGALANPHALRRVRALHTHPAAEVRVHVARALRRLAEPETPPVLLRLLADTDWRVRAQAARALGALRVGAATDELAVAVCDPAWWVRYRAALALAQIGGEARAALVAVTTADDALARDMAMLVSGLSSAAVLEMSEV